MKATYNRPASQYTYKPARTHTDTYTHTHQNTLRYHGYEQGHLPCLGRLVVQGTILLINGVHSCKPKADVTAQLRKSLTSFAWNRGTGPALSASVIGLCLSRADVSNVAHPQISRHSLRGVSGMVKEPEPHMQQITFTHH